MAQPCPMCGREFEPLQGKYAPDGTIVCVPCGERTALAQTQLERRNIGSAFVGAWGALLIALLSFVVESRVVFFLFPLIAIGGGVGVSVTAIRNERARESLGWKRIPTVVVGSLAALVGLSSLVLGFAVR